MLTARTEPLAAFTPHWSTPLLGMSWEKVGTCLGLWYAVQTQHYGLPIPLPPHAYGTPVRTWYLRILRKFRQVDVPKDGDTVIMRRGNGETHIGVYVERDGGLVVSAVRDHGVCALSWWEVNAAGHGHPKILRWSGEEGGQQFEDEGVPGGGGGAGGDSNPLQAALLVGTLAASFLIPGGQVVAGVAGSAFEAGVVSSMGAGVTLGKASAVALKMGVLALGALGAQALAPNRPDQEAQLGNPSYAGAQFGNRPRPRLPVPDIAGRNLVTLDLAAQPYFDSISGDEESFYFLAVGRGSYDIEEVRFGTTPFWRNGSVLPEFADDVSVEVVEPFNPCTLFPVRVHSSEEVAGIQLIGANEVDPGETGAVGPFLAAPVGTEPYRLACDFLVPQLYKQSDEGNLLDQTVTVQVDVYNVDVNGAPTTLVKSVTESLTDDTTKPRRFSVIIADLPAADYAVSVTKTTNTDNPTTNADTIFWTQLRGYVNDQRDYGDITCIAVRIGKSQNIGSGAQNDIKAIVTRQLVPVGFVDSLSARTTTRSPARYAWWIMSQIAEAADIPSAVLDSSTLVTAETEWGVNGWTYDFVHTQKTSAWQALNQCLDVAHSYPLWKGNQLAVVRDDLAPTTPRTLLTPANSAPGYSATFFMQTNEVPDSLLVSYVSGVTGEQVEILAELPGTEGTTSRAQEIQAPGITDGTRAYKWGVRKLAELVYRRNTFSRELPMSGILLEPRALVLLADDVAATSVTGLVEEVVGVTTLRLSDPVEFEAGIAYYLYLDRLEGVETYTATAGADAYEVVLSSVPPDTSANPLRTVAEDGPGLATRFAFGPGGDGLAAIPALVAAITPSAHTEGRYEISCVEDIAAVYTAADGTGPTPPAPSVDGLTLLPAVRTLVLTNTGTVASPQVTASWTEAEGAISYVVETSRDQETWGAVVASTTDLTSDISLTAGLWYVAVSGVGAGGQGPRAVQSIQVTGTYLVPGTVSNLHLASAYNGVAEVEWTPGTNATWGQVNVYDPDGDLAYNLPTFQIAFDWTVALGELYGGPWREFSIGVVSNSPAGASPEVKLLISNPAPAAPSVSVTSGTSSLTLTWAGDTNATGWRGELRTLPNFEGETILVGSWDTSALSVVISGLATETTYQWTATAYDDYIPDPDSPESSGQASTD